MRWSIVILVAWSVAFPTQQDTAARADAAFQAGEWEAAVELLQALARDDALDPEGHYKLGYSHWRLGNCEQALLAYLGTRESHGGHPRMLGTAAICAARLGRSAEALGDLDAALAAGAPPGVLLNDPAIRQYASDPRYQAIAAPYAAQLQPCMADEEARRFDFWIGDWDVYASGVIAGRNTITMEQDGCLLREEWVTSGGSGTSINFVDRVHGTWRQIWTDNVGNITHYEGTFVDGSLRLEGTNIGSGGGVSRARMTFTPNEDGSVRQLVESSSDDGETWSITFDGRYVRRSES